MRIPISDDGHFWVDAAVNGHQMRFLVDSGASITTISTSAAEQVGLSTGLQISSVETANGDVKMVRGHADHLRVGDIKRSNFGININPNDATNVLGMNFLSSLSSWQVERRYLILRE